LNHKYIYFLVFFLNVIFHTVYSQEILNQTIDKDYTGYSITDTFLELEKEFGVKFYYKANWIDNVAIPELPKNLKLKDFIEKTLSTSNLSFIEIQGVNIILVPSGYNLVLDKDNISLIKPIGNSIEKGKYAFNKVEGFVRFGKTGEPIAGAVVYNKKHNKQTTTDQNGHYVMNLPGGFSKMEFSFIGLEKNEIEVEVFSNGTLDCDLFDTPIQIEAVNVTAYSGKSNVERTQMGVVHVEMKSLNKLPVIMGEADVIKGMTLLPGVQSSGEMAAGFNVRGGNIDQNQILVDGAPMYSTSHLFGLFTSLVPDAISNVSFHKGTQSANYGGRLSSVMDIQLKNPKNDKLNGKASIGVLNSGVFIEGPVKKDFCTFLFGARTTYSNWLLKEIPDIDIRQSKTNFYDLIGSLNFNLNNKNQLKVFGYYSYDYFKYSNMNIYAYGSLMGGENYRRSITDNFSMRANVAYTDYHNELSNIEDAYLAATVNTGITQLLSKVEFNLELKKQSIVFGAEGINNSINPGLKEKYGDVSSIIPEEIDTEKALELAGFIHDNIAITDKLSFLVGLRYSWFSKYGSSQSFVYDPNRFVSENSVIDTIFHSNGEFVKPYSGFEPRVGIKFGLDESSSIKAGYHISRQYQHLISNSSSPTPSDYWKTADLNIKPMKSQQFSLGYFKNFLSNIIETSAEVYYKEINNPLDYRNGAVLAMNATIEREVISGFSKTYGLEVMVKKNAGKINGWVSYTLSQALIKIDGEYPEDKINGGKFFPTYNNRLHDLSISTNYQFTRRWNFAGNFILSSGRPATFPEKKYVYRNTEVVYFSERNKYQLPAYHRLDIAITYEGYLKKTKKVHPSFTFSVYNVYGHKNIYSVYYKKDIPSSENDYQVYGLYKLSIIGVPIPSFTVNLRF
jgi:hypothetical protein